MSQPAPPAETLLQKTRFLIVDDLAARSELAERYLLLGSALQVRKAATPLAALRVLQDPKTPIDCVLCAQEFSPMSGLEFLQNIRAGRYGGRTLSEIKFVLLLRKNDAHVIQSADALRVGGHLVGAFTRDSFTEVIVQALRPPQSKSGEPQTPTGPLVLAPLKPGAVRLAHIREQGVDLVIVPLETSFGKKTPQEQHEHLTALRASASRARLQGEVIPVWDMGDGTMGFLAPAGFHPYFKSISLEFIQANLNREMMID